MLRGQVCRELPQLLVGYLRPNLIEGVPKRPLGRGGSSVRSQRLWCGRRRGLTVAADGYKLPRRVPPRAAGCGKR